MTTLQQQARALGDPTRYAIFRYLADGGEETTVAELTGYLELNHNAIRQHLAKLVGTGLVIETTAAPTGPGRPRLLYSVHPNAHSRWNGPGPYERLSVLLAEIIRTGDTPVDVGRRATRDQIDTPASDDPVGHLVARMAHDGFDPILEEHDGRVDVVLRACPFETAAVADPDTVCDLHLGIALGVADRHPDLVIDELHRKDPRRAQCRVQCHTVAQPHTADDGDTPETPGS